MRLTLEILLGAKQTLHLLGERRIGTDPIFLHRLGLAAEFFQGFVDRLDQGIDGLAAGFQFALGGLLKTAQVLFGEVQESLVIALQRLGRECAEGIGKLDFGRLQQGQLLASGLALLGQLHLQRGTPALLLAGSSTQGRQFTFAHVGLRLQDRYAVGTRLGTGTTLGFRAPGGLQLGVVALHFFQCPPLAFNLLGECRLASFQPGLLGTPAATQPE